MQGITGAEGSHHTERMLKYGTNIVGGVTPGKGGQTTSHGLPVFDTVKDAVAATGATHTCIFVPPPFAADALFEAYDAGIGMAVCITEGVPVHDVLKVVGTTPGMRIIGPNCPGLISPGKSSVGIMPGPHLPRGQRRLGFALRHLDLRSGRRTYAGGAGPIDLRRRRRRPDHRDDLRRLPARIRERFSNERDRTVRRDRRLRRRRRRRVHRRASAADADRRPLSAAATPLRASRSATPARSSRAPSAPPRARSRHFRTAGVPVADRPSEVPGLLARRIAEMGAAQA